MAAAISAAKNGHKVILFEQNEKLGKKLFITGKGRCNLTNACDTQDLFEQVVQNPKFLYSAIYGFDNFQTMDFFEQAGVPLKTERGNRVFPQSDHSSDIIRALEKEMQRCAVEVKLNACVKELKMTQNHIEGLTLTDGTGDTFDAVILATGGLSYPQTGSTGDGLRFAKACGHRIMDCSPSLVPMEIREEELFSLMGLSLRNVTLRFFQNKKKLGEEFGEMLFTHFGISGPLVLSASARYNKLLENAVLDCEIDLKPALSEEQLDQRIVRDFQAQANKDFANALFGLYPAKLIPVMIARSRIDPHKKVHDIQKEERKRLVTLTKAFPLTVTKLRGYKEAIVTSGGVSVKDIDPSTMESKLISDLYFAGEMIDVDALTGGFNLQIAWSTGVLAGRSIPTAE